MGYIKWILLFPLLLGLMGCESNNDQRNKLKPQGFRKVSPENSDETARLELGNLSNKKSTYSFFHHTRDSLGKTGDRWDLLANKSAGVFQVSLAAHDRGSIVDLGFTNCKDIQLSDQQMVDFSEDIKGSVVSHHRHSSPEYWFGFSEAGRALQMEPKMVLPILKGHCYALSNLNLKYAVSALFYVKELTESEVQLSQIEIFQKQRFSNK